MFYLYTSTVSILRKIRNELRLFDVPADSDGALLLTGVLTITILLGVAPLLADGGDTEPSKEAVLGYYDPGADEIHILINESNPKYEAVVYHENMHQDFYHQFPALQHAHLVRIAGLMLLAAGLYTLRPKLFLVAGAIYWTPSVIIEMHAITLTFLKFQDFHSVLYALHQFVIYFWFIFGASYIKNTRKRMRHKPALHQDWRGYLSRSKKWWKEFYIDHKKMATMVYLGFRIKIRQLRDWL